MHQSYVPGQQTSILTSYLDDSGSDDLSEVTTIGGLTLSKEAFLEFDLEWNKLLDLYRIPQPLHMKDFVRPYGKHIGMYREMKIALFTEVAELINKFKLYSMSVSVRRDEFDADLPIEVRRLIIGPYGLAFFCVILSNHGFSQRTLVYPAERISYLLDVGFPHSDQLRAVHSAIIHALKRSGRTCFIGEMAQDSDDRVSALQAADVIAWASRRRELATLTEEFAKLHWPIRGDCSHAHVHVPHGGIRMFANPIMNWLSKGTVPTLEQIFR